MLTPLEIAFHGLEKSDAVEERIRMKFAKLEQHFERMTHGRVVVSQSARRAPMAKKYEVTIEIGLPGQQPIVVNYEPPIEEAQSDVMVALRDAFAAATRQVEHRVGRMDKPARREQSRRRPVRPAETD